VVNVATSQINVAEAILAQASVNNTAVVAVHQFFLLTDFIFELKFALILYQREVELELEEANGLVQTIL